jgi:hypothetical protein
VLWYCETLAIVSSQGTFESIEKIDFGIGFVGNMYDARGW